MKKYLLAKDIAHLEDVDKSTVSRWIQKGYFPNTRKVGRFLKIPIESYHKWRESTKLENQHEVEERSG